MATVMADGQTPAELEEELTVQRVILESLADQTFEGVEESRREAAKEIERLKAIIGQSKQSQAPAQHGDVSGELREFLPRSARACEPLHMVCDASGQARAPNTYRGKLG